ncbi:Receptor-type tyrosine-protein phosphatase F [Liparis tanakae]|uniref:Receptor-type tyrosine-protein phosphatase F n=1 Tax=Liparis tanakae TaxID=230148 RepID=A0A4Z2JF19_9TELE|nr:Receptor-type tyrosine-protein phosphatase F [Liparis tanakae]
MSQDWDILDRNDEYRLWRQGVEDLRPLYVRDVEQTAGNGANGVKLNVLARSLGQRLAVIERISVCLVESIGFQHRHIVPDPQGSFSIFCLGENQVPHGFPTIDMGPQLKVVERTRTATMLCAASGNPDPEISWFKDMLPVDISNSNGRIKQLRSGHCGPQRTYLPPLCSLNVNQNGCICITPMQHRPPAQGAGGLVEIVKVESFNPFSW